MRQLLALERRLQDLERMIQNQTRPGSVKEVKFDDEKKRWYVKMEQGSGDETFKSDWLPWRSFSHGSISESRPPRKGMKIAMTSPNGFAEMAFAEPYHYDPDNPSPHGKENEVVRLVETPEDDEQTEGQGGSQGGQSGSSQSGQSQEKYEHWKHETDQSYGITIRKKKQQSGGAGGGQQSASKEGDQEQSSGKPKRERKLPEVPEDGEKDAVQVKSTKDGHLITVGDKTKIQAKGDKVTLKQGDSSIVIEGSKMVLSQGQASITFEDGKITLKATEIITDGTTKLDKGTARVETQAGPAQRVYAKP